MATKTQSFGDLIAAAEQTLLAEYGDANAIDRPAADRDLGPLDAAAAETAAEHQRLRDSRPAGYTSSKELQEQCIAASGREQDARNALRKARDDQREAKRRITDRSALITADTDIAAAKAECERLTTEAANCDTAIERMVAAMAKVRDRQAKSETAAREARARLSDALLGDDLKTTALESACERAEASARHDDQAVRAASVQLAALSRQRVQISEQHASAREKHAIACGFRSVLRLRALARVIEPELVAAHAGHALIGWRCELPQPAASQVKARTSELESTIPPLTAPSTVEAELPEAA